MLSGCCWNSEAFIHHLVKRSLYPGYTTFVRFAAVFLNIRMVASVQRGDLLVIAVFLSSRSFSAKQR